MKITSLQLWEGILTWLIYKLVLRYFLLLIKNLNIIISPVKTLGYVVYKLVWKQNK